MKKILITGGAGFIGSALRKELQNRGNNVKVIDLKESILSDITDIKSIGEDVDVVYHLAAQSRVQPSFDNPSETFRTNVQGTVNACEIAKSCGAKLVYAGSSSKHHNPHDSPYAASKWLGEEVIKTYKECYGLNAEIARFYNVYGPGEALDPIHGNVIGIWRYNMENNLPIKIVGDGEQRRDFTHVDDIVDGLIRIADNKYHKLEGWELGTGVNYSIKNLAGMFERHFDDVMIEYIPDQKGNYRATLNTSTDAKMLLGWAPGNRLEEHIKLISNETNKV